MRYRSQSYLAILALIFAASGFMSSCNNLAPAQQNASQSSSEMRAYCDQLDLYVVGNLNRPTFLQDRPNGPWRKRLTQKDEKKQPYSEANVWFRSGSPVVANISMNVRNLQQVKALKLYFRPDGTVVKETFTAINKGKNALSFFEIKYFDQTGKLAHKRRKVINRQTQKEYSSKNWPFQNPQIRKVSDLPFAKLL